MKLQDLKKLKPEELDKKLREFKEELFKLNSASLAGEDSLKKKGRISTVKRDIARVKTLLNEQ